MFRKITEKSCEISQTFIFVANSMFQIVAQSSSGSVAEPEGKGDGC